MPIQSVEFWEEEAWLAEEAGETMRIAAARAAKLDLHALEQELDFAVERPRAWWQRVLRRSS